MAEVGARHRWIALVGVLFCIALFVCTSMIYICLKFLQEWHTLLTLVNFVLLGAASGALLAALDRSCLKHVIAAHLSQRNNTPELARAALAVALGCAPEWVEVATQEDGFSWREI